jgi:hypothetical protein
MTAAAALRRYAVLSFLLWLPTGLYLVPLVLLMRCCAACPRPSRPGCEWRGATGS